MDQWIVEVGKIVGPAVVSFFAGRASKNRELMSSDLDARTKEFRELVSKIAANASAYWAREQDETAAIIGDELTRDLHKMQRLRIYCGAAAAGYRTNFFRERETQFFEAVSGDDFQGRSRAVDDGTRIRVIKNIAGDLDFLALEARRADLFLIPYEKIRAWYFGRFGRH